MPEWVSFVLDAGFPGAREEPGPTPSPSAFVPGPARRILADLLADLRAASGEESPDLARLRRRFETGDLDAADLLQAVWKPDRHRLAPLAERAGVAPEVLEFLGIYLARPFRVAAARARKDSVPGEQARGAPGDGNGKRGGTAPAHDHPENEPRDSGRETCPGCGAPPAVTFLLPEEGQRNAWCRGCGREWRVERLRCLACGNTDTATLGYFTLGDDTARRVDFCRRCGSYVKTMDLRQTGGGNDPARGDRADLTTGDLDLAAVREGFAPVGRTTIAEQEAGFRSEEVSHEAHPS